MSKILTKDEAQAIVKMMLEPLGFGVCVLHYDDKADADIAYRLCNSKTVKKTIGSLWWKKTVEVTTLSTAFAGWCWEDAIEKLDNWLKTKVRPRVVLAEKLRDEYAQKEATKALDDELSKQ